MNITGLFVVVSRSSVLTGVRVRVSVQDSWLFHLSVAAGTSAGTVGTDFEQLVGKLFQLDGDPSQ